MSKYDRPCNPCLFLFTVCPLFLRAGTQSFSFGHKSYLASLEGNSCTPLGKFRFPFASTFFPLQGNFRFLARELLLPYKGTRVTLRGNDSSLKWKLQGNCSPFIYSLIYTFFLPLLFWSNLVSAHFICGSIMGQVGVAWQIFIRVICGKNMSRACKFCSVNSI